jgi:hypothetical protein
MWQMDWRYSPLYITISDKPFELATAVYLPFFLPNWIIEIGVPCLGKSKKKYTYEEAIHDYWLGTFTAHLSLLEGELGVWLNGSDMKFSPKHCHGLDVINSRLQQLEKAYPKRE